MIESIETFRAPATPPWSGSVISLLGGGWPFLLSAGMLFALGRGRRRIDMSGWGEFLWIPPRGVAEFSAVEFIDDDEEGA